jgi:plasmid stability protein
MNTFGCRKRRTLEIIWIMTMLQIRLPDELKTKLLVRAAESGFDSVEAYIEALVRTEAGEDVVHDAQLESLLLRRLDDPGTVEFAPTFVRQFKKEVAKRSRAHS